VLGCASGGLGSDAGASTTPGASTSPAPAAAATPTPQTQPSGSATGCPNGSLEGCFSYSQMGSFLESVRPLVARYFQTAFPNVPGPRNVVYIPRGRVAASCGGYSNSYAYEYCGANRTIYIGQDLLWSFYSRQGDAAPVIGLAHEWGHHVQVMLGVPMGRTAAQSVLFENQADCLSGAFTRYAGEQGWLESDDLDDIGGLLRVVGSREGPGRDHGTAAERAQSFDLGYKGGARACNAFFPSSPVA
jgi:predicted metalloprotease